MQTETASALAETEGGREICTGNLQYTLPVASSRSISSLKCRDMRGRPSIYAFYGIIGVHISFGITCGCRCGGPMWYSRSFADAQDDKKPLGMTMLCTRSFTPSAAPSMVTRKGLRSGWDNGPRTRLFCIVLYLNELQKVDVRGPLSVERFCVCGIQPSATTKLKTHTSPVILIPYQLKRHKHRRLPFILEQFCIYRESGYR